MTDTVAAGGKVLVPVFAVGRVQELMLILQEHWRQAGLTVRPGAGLGCLSGCVLHAACCVLRAACECCMKACLLTAGVKG